MTQPDGRKSLFIGDLARRAGVNPKTVRYYESIGVLPSPSRSSNGYRVYSPADVTRLVFIRRAQALGLSLAAIQDILALQDAGNRPCEEVHQAASRRVHKLDRQVAELQRLRNELASLAERATLSGIADGASCDYCPAILEPPL